MSGGAGGRTFAERLRLLMDEVHNPGTGKPYTYAEIVAGIETRSRELGLAPEASDLRKMSVQYVGQLVNGVKINPTLHRMQALADHFQVPTDYFTSEDTGQLHRQPADLAFAAAPRTEGIDDIVFRARGLSPDSLRWISTAIEHARKLEGLPDAEQRDNGASRPADESGQ